MVEKTCFVVSPIGAAGTEVRRRSDAMFHHVIAAAANAMGFIVIRADQIIAPGLITAQVIKHLLEAD